ncbi:hypothetical protein NLG97_g7671 [Lecanicillium saksenae]|uniref:Uncharacterized protein n=1 Tax=Lecanicillium saksenae TaxID=468837 RepID=A0ACC1QMT4_9HYPO|nr:hypothetical protein NLG97_g7671 [Lecanicillium saksenae]
MPGSLEEGEVLVTLSCLAPTNLTFPQRRLLLSNQKSLIFIGRASKRSSTLESRMYNAWIDAPVMSREHAELKLDNQSQVRISLSIFCATTFSLANTDLQTVFIRDVGSLHGTYHNDTKLRQGQSQALSNGDLLKFGISIDRGHENFPQCTMKVGLEFGPAIEQAEMEARYGYNLENEDEELTLHSLPRPTVFQVPDDSESDMDQTEEMEEINSIADDDDDSDLRAGAAILAENGLDLTEFHGFDTSDPIDLTSEPDLVSEDNIPSSSSPVSEEEADFTLGTVELDDADLGNLDDTPLVRPSQGFAPATQFREASVDIADDETPGMDGPLSEDQVLPPISESSPLMMRAKSLGEISGKPEYFIAREQNRLHVQSALASQMPEIEPVTESQNGEAAHSSCITEVPAEVATPDSESKKRKADEISGSTPAEDQADTDNSVSISGQNSPPQEVPSNTEEAPVYKRIKTAAEYFGFVAIGGAAVMTALIATAPSF